MSAKTKCAFLLIASLLPVCALSLNTNSSSVENALTKQLGWVRSHDNNCGGYYFEPPFIYPVNINKHQENYIEVTSNQTLFSQRGTSLLEGKVSLTRYSQQITANKAYLYRDPVTGKLSTMEMIGDVHLREPNTLVVGKRGRYNFQTKSKTLLEILYRTSLSGKEVIGPKVSDADIQKQRKITAMTAWGKAYEFSQTEPRIYELRRASFTTCPPTHPAWHVKASHIVLDKNTGRGYATHARIYVKSVPVFYIPYINFSIDRQRKTGFLWPTIGGSNTWGPYFLAPFYWDMAPNYDMTITPGLLSKRGVQLSDKIRYLGFRGEGSLNFSLLPGDKFFSEFQDASEEKYSGSTSPVIQSELNRLINASTTRKSFSWRDETRYDDHWSSHVDLNYAGDDYYLRDFGSNLNEITQNQLLQDAELYYKAENWNVTGRIQGYQTLHPIDEPAVQNQYRRFPQIIFNGDYPDQAFGLEYFINNEVTHFDIRNTPGTDANLPIGNRINVQPGVSWPFYLPYFYINPRFQLALTNYNLYQTADTNAPGNKHRVIPILDVASGLSFIRDLPLFDHAFEQTLEPQLYYTYIPYRNQMSIPIFDTTVNTLTYDQLFNYNRFSGIDRIGDANQVGVGVTTRLIDQNSGLEKIRLGVGEILYFTNRRVTFCNDNSCTDNPQNPSNHWRLSPISGLLNYNVNPSWSMSANAIWNPISKQLGNSTINLHYKPDEQRILNLGYGFARNGDVLNGINVNSSQNNLKLTDFSFSWPVISDISAVGRWSQNWNQQHLQNLLYGLQYDTCCWAVRFVGGRALTNLDPTENNKPQYNSEFYIQVALKGLGNIGSGNPSGLLSSITGYNTQFGQEF